MRHLTTKQKEKIVSEQIESTESNFELETVRQAIADSTPNTAIYIGCDSKRYIRGGKRKVAYVTVVILHLDQKHGGKIYRQVLIEDDYGIQMRQRLMNEVYHAVGIAMSLQDVIGDRIFELHLDIGSNEIENKSSIILKEAMGYVRGTMGFDPKVKPVAFAASSAADTFTVKIADVPKRLRRKPQEPVIVKVNA